MSGRKYSTTHTGNLENLFANSRLRREWQTVAAMIQRHCRKRHHHAEEDCALCADCQDLLDYATARLRRCCFGEHKPTCANCPVHCYQRDRREQIKIVMRHAGPHMLYLHPILTLRHWLDGLTPRAEPKAS